MENAEKPPQQPQEQQTAATIEKDEEKAINTETATATTMNISNDNKGGADSAPAANATPKLQQYGAGYCPIKPEYIRGRPVDAEGAAIRPEKGMNKGCEREHMNIQGTDKPTFEGEVNFLRGDVLQKVKSAIRTTMNQKRERKETQQPQDQQQPQQEEKAGGEGEAKEEEEGGDVKKEDAEKNDDIVATLPPPPPPPPQAPLQQQQQQQQQQHLDDNRARAAAATRMTPEELRAHREKLFTNKLVLAPLTTVGNLPYRRICKKMGVDITISEMALVFNLKQIQKSEWSLLRRHESEDIFGLQLAPNRGLEASAVAAALEASGYSYDFIEINSGCPVDMMVQKGLGCGLFEKRNKLQECTRALVQHQSQPVTIKCRVGADESAPVLHRCIHSFEEWGASGVTIHGRSRRQRYTKLANWDYINTTAPLTQLPVTGNGDIMSYDDAALHKARHPNVTSYMIGRGALIKPWVFREIKEERTWDISSAERLELLRDFANYGMAHWGSDEKGVATTRRFLCEWLSFACRYVPVGLLERLPQRINERPPYYEGRDELETLMASDNVRDWVRLTELVLGPAGDKFKFTPKHKSNSYSIDSGKDKLAYDDE